ncbi:glycosyltransferase family 2 protein [Olleya aquimaris]|uniref:Glycosyltransferase involved in cell wall biosynthesis n=1 Tax=Olleya aquimaris TaxID=639310 RepID=A0A327RJ84_9FLAO|nr:glycosyltransferase family 2 protein [Olleya aquimaris]RAJ16979.1 glycosyltransferase involved in cell wall biosynthesis [Olleya aquimaris]
MEATVSVIIPVFNAEQYIEKAIISAIQQPEVKQIIVVNDGSTDNTEHILDKLLIDYSILEVYYHTNKENRGRSATRNLALQKAKCNYIAFLDADDFYLEHRFLKDFEIINHNKFLDGVYNAIGVHFYREYKDSEFEKLKLTTITKKISPENLFENLIYHKNGHFSLDGLLLKSDVFNKIGLFNEELAVGEDSDLILKAAIVCKLESGQIDKPVAIRGVHEKNIFNNSQFYSDYNFKVFESLLFWCYKKNVDLKYVDWIMDNLWRLKFKEKLSMLTYIRYWSTLFIINPKVLFSKLAIKYFPLIRLRKQYFSFLYNK